MSKTTLAGRAAALLLCALPLTAGAWERASSIDERQDRQQQRIVEGWRAGELTHGEAHRLQAEQRAIRREERLYRADGVLTEDERRELQRDLDRAGRHIREQSHDADRRHWGGYPAFGEHGVDQRQYNQQRRIGEGIRAGELTGAEVAALRQEQRVIRAEERAYRADGMLSHDEWRELRRDLDAAGRHIHEDRNDAERRY